VGRTWTGIGEGSCGPWPGRRRVGARGSARAAGLPPRATACSSGGPA